MPKRRKRGRPRTGSRQVIPVRLAAKQVKKITKLAELESVDRSTVLRSLIDIGLNSPQVWLLMRRPGIRGKRAIDRVVRVAAATARAATAKSALMRVPTVEAEIKALRTEEELEQALSDAADRLALQRATKYAR